MHETFRERDLIAPTKTELLCGLGCWLLYLSGIPELLRWLLPLLGFDLGTVKGAGLAQIAAFVLDFILILLVFRKFLWRSVRPLKGNGRLLLSGIARGLVLYWLLGYLVSLVILLLSAGMEVVADNRNNDTIVAILMNDTVPMAVSTIVLAPVTEECLVRGVLFAPLCKRKPWVAYLASTVLFGLLHVVTHYSLKSELLLMLLSFLQYLPAGIALGWVYQRTRSIWGAIALHMLINSVAVAAML